MSTTRFTPETVPAILLYGPAALPAAGQTADGSSATSFTAAATPELRPLTEGLEVLRTHGFNPDVVKAYGQIIPAMAQRELREATAAAALQGHSVNMNYTPDADAPLGLSARCTQGRDWVTTAIAQGVERRLSAILRRPDALPDYIQPLSELPESSGDAPVVSR